MAFYSAITAYEWNFMECDYIKGLIPDEWYFSQKYRISLSLSLSRKRQIHRPRVISTDVRAGAGRGCKEWLPITGGIARREISRGRFASFREGDKDRRRELSLQISISLDRVKRISLSSPLLFQNKTSLQEFNSKNSSNLSSRSPSYI